MIQQVVENKKPPPTDPNFQSYPQTNDPELQDFYSRKKFNSNQLFLDSMDIEDPCHSDFMIKPHQIVLKNFMNKNHRITVYLCIMG